jgi:hypothetical protein
LAPLSAIVFGVTCVSKKIIEEADYATKKTSSRRCFHWCAGALAAPHVGHEPRRIEQSIGRDFPANSKGVNRISASRLFELSHALDVPVQFFFDGLDEPTDPYPEAGMADEPLLNPYLDFVSSGQGVELNRAFLEITDDDLRRQLLSVVSNIARVNRTQD